MMKKMVSLLIIAALLAQSADMSAAKRARKAAQVQKSKLATWAAPFLSEVSTAIKNRNFRALPAILKKYKTQAVAVGASAVVIAVALGLTIHAFTEPSEQVAVATLFEVKPGIQEIEELAAEEEVSTTQRREEPAPLPPTTKRVYGVGAFIPPDEWPPWWGPYPTGQFKIHPEWKAEWKRLFPQESQYEEDE